jgi:hypothetical protein
MDGVAMTIADHGELSVARMLVTTTEGDVAASDTSVGCGPHCPGVMGHPRVQYRPGRALLSRRLRALILRLDRTTVRGLVVDDDRGSCVVICRSKLQFLQKWHSAGVSRGTPHRLSPLW